MRYSNWGRQNSSKQYFRGCRRVDCEGHGGILITEKTMMNHPYFEKLRTYPGINDFYENGQYVFEEDSDASIIHSVLPDEVIQEFYAHYFKQESNTLEKFRDIDARVLIRQYPALYTHLNGRELSIFESESLLRELISNSETRLHFVSARWGDWAWDVPEGYIYFECYDQHNNSWDTGYLIKKAIYEQEKYNPSYLPIDVSGLKTFTPDKSLPYSKPKPEITG